MYYFIIAALVAADQLTKYLVHSGMDLNSSIPLIDGIFHLTYIHNYGAAFSILQNQQFLLQTVSGAAIFIMLGVLIRKGKTFYPMVGISLAFIIAGGVGNLLDRFSKGYVVDFFDFRVFPIFNVADIAVCCGCGLLIFYVLYWEGRLERKERELNSAAEKEE